MARKKKKLFPLGGLKKKVHGDGEVGSYTCLCHRLWKYSHGDLAGVKVCGGWPGPGTLWGPDRDSQWTTEAGRIRTMSYETYHKFISCRMPGGSSQLNQISTNTSQHSPKENHGATPSSWTYEDPSPLLWRFKRGWGVGRNLNNNSKRSFTLVD